MSKIRVLRGGSYADATWNLRSANRGGRLGARDRREPEYRGWCYGFRIVVKRKKQ